MNDLSPAAQAVLNAATIRWFDVDDDIPAQVAAARRQAATLRTAADQVAPSDADEPRNSLPMAIECQRIRAELLAIAAELEGNG